MISERGLMMTYLVSHPRISRARATHAIGSITRPGKVGRFLPTMEAIATARGVELEVAKAQASTMQEREFSYGAFQVSGRLDDGGRPGVRKLFASFERMVVQIVASKLSIMTEQAVCSWLKHKR